MTKLKSKKMTKSTFAIIIMAIIMVAMLAFGGTYAYFTATTTDNKPTFITGTVQLAANTVNVLDSGSYAVSGTKVITSDIAVNNMSNVKTYIFMKLSAKFTESDGTTVVTGATQITTSKNDCDANNEYFLEYTLADGWALVDGKTDIYFKVAEKATLSGEATSEAIAVTKNGGITFWGYSASTESQPGTLMNKKVSVVFQSASIQYDGFEAVSESNTEAKRAATAFAKVTLDDPAS